MSKKDWIEISKNISIFFVMFILAAIIVWILANHL